MDTIYLREEFKLMLLNRSEKVLGIHELSVGGITGTVADPGIVMLVAILELAKSVITTTTTRLGALHQASPMRISPKN